MHPEDRLAVIGRARHADAARGATVGAGLVEPWIELAPGAAWLLGLQPSQRVGFDARSLAGWHAPPESPAARCDAARPGAAAPGAPSRARYFAILTDARGVVVDTHGPIVPPIAAPRDPRVGVDLSEDAPVTTAISAALSERLPVWLHRGEHFFDDTSVYSCAGALFRTDGRCVGVARPDGRRGSPGGPSSSITVTESARGIENALLCRRPHALLTSFA